MQRQDQYGLARLQKSLVHVEAGFYNLVAQSNPFRIALFISKYILPGFPIVYTAGPAIVNAAIGQQEAIDTTNVDRNYTIDGPLVCYDWYALSTGGDSDVVVIEYIADIDPCSQQARFCPPSQPSGIDLSQVIASFKSQQASIISLQQLIREQ